jgi:hypothetical protein
MFTKEEIKNSIQNIVNLSNEDPEEIYVTKWTIENKLKEKDPSYTKKTLAKFINDLHLGRFIFVHNGSSLPFSIYGGYVFVATESNDFSYFINSLSKLDYDLNNLKKYDYMKLFDSTPYDSDYFLIDGVLMISDRLKL